MARGNFLITLLKPFLILKTLRLLPRRSLAIVNEALAARKFERRRNIFRCGDLLRLSRAELNCNDVIVDGSRNNIAQSHVVEVNNVIMRGVEDLGVALAKEEIVCVVRAVENIRVAPERTFRNGRVFRRVPRPSQLPPV